MFAYTSSIASVMIRKIATSLARDRVRLILSDLISEKSTRRLHKKRLLNDHSFDQPLSMITSLNRWLLARFLSFTPRGVFSSLLWSAFFSSLNATITIANPVITRYARGDYDRNSEGRIGGFLPRRDEEKNLLVPCTLRIGERKLVKKKGRKGCD